MGACVQARTLPLTVTIDGPTDSLAIEISGPVQKARGTPADDMYADPERF
jgi:hypothetical protein